MVEDEQILKQEKESVCHVSGLCEVHGVPLIELTSRVSLILGCIS